jgi:hypothetical protein
MIYGTGQGLATGVSDFTVTAGRVSLPRVAPRNMYTLTFADDDLSAALPNPYEWCGPTVYQGDEVLLWILGEHEGDIYPSDGSGNGPSVRISGVGLPGVASAGDPLHVVPGQTILFVYMGYLQDAAVWFSIVSA